jgi:hypothetical protein
MPKKLTCADLIERRADYNDFMAAIEADQINEDEVEKFCRLQMRFGQRCADEMAAKRPGDNTVTFGDLFTEDDVERFWNETVATHESEENPEVTIQCDGDDLFVIRNGVKIAKRGQPDTAQAKQWISVEPGFTVLGDDDGLVIEQHGAALH